MVLAKLTIMAQCNEDMASLLKLFGMIQHAGEVGSCCDIKAIVDGDGSGHYRFNLHDENDNLVPLPSVEPTNNAVWLGE